MTTPAISHLLLLSLALVPTACEVPDRSPFTGGTQNALCQPGCDDPDLLGSYRLESRFDVSEGLPTAKLSALQVFIDITDDPYDPATWLLERIAVELPAEYRTVLTNARGWLMLDERLNRFLLQYSPRFVRQMIDVGDDMGQVVDSLGLQSRLTIAYDPMAPTGGVATHEVTGALFWVDEARYEFTSEQMSWPHVAAEGIPLVIRPNDTLDIQTHELGLPYGDLLLFAVENVVLPRHDPQGRTFNELLTGLIDCPGVAQILANELGSALPDELTVDELTMICLGVVQGGTAAVESLLRDLVDVPASLDIAGRTLPVDDDCDCRIDNLHEGDWLGDLAFEDGRLALPAPDQDFAGVREE